MGVIKGVLHEELQNAIRLKAEYQKALKKVRGGSIVKKNINGRPYYYLAFRQGDKVKFVYQGKQLSDKFKLELKKSNALRNKHKGLIRDLNKRIKYLKKVLNGKEDV